MTKYLTMRAIFCAVLIPLALLSFAPCAWAQADAPPATPPAADNPFEGIGPG
jgi:hypothetical protein